MLILLSGAMIGSTLFAVPKKGDACDLRLMVREWVYAQPLEGAGVAYYSRMETEALRGMSIEQRYDRLMRFQRRVHFPLRRRRVSKTFLSLLKYYLPNNDDCPNAKIWRSTIATMMREFRSGRTNIAEIQIKMRSFCLKANRGEIVFDNHANGCVILNLVLFELERLMRIVR